MATQPTNDGKALVMAMKWQKSDLGYTLDTCTILLR